MIIVLTKRHSPMNIVDRVFRCERPSRKYHFGHERSLRKWQTDVVRKREGQTERAKETLFKERNRLTYKELEKQRTKKGSQTTKRTEQIKEQKENTRGDEADVVLKMRDKLLSVFVVRMGRLRNTKTFLNFASTRFGTELVDWK